MRNSLFILPILLACSILTLMGCPGSNSPTSPSNPPTPTKSPTITFTPTITSTPNVNIHWNFAEIYNNLQNGVPNGSYAILKIQVNGLADAAVTAVLSGTNLSTPVTLPYVSNVVYSGQTCAQYQSTNFTYQTGATYTLTTLTVAGTASQSFVAPGNVSIASDGSQATWTGGNNDSVQVDDSSNTTTFNSQTYTNNAISPFSIPVTAYPAIGVYTVAAYATNSTTNINNGSGYFYVTQSDFLSVTLSGNTYTPTKTPTNTPTDTPTSTFSNTPTSSNTSTSTPTLTASSTPTNSATSTSTFTPTNTTTSTPTQTPTPTPSGTPTPTRTFTPYPTPAFVLSWSTTGTNQASISGSILFVADYGNSQILKYTLTGGAYPPLSNYGTGNGQLDGPTGVVADAGGNIYVVDKVNERIQALTANTGAYLWKTGTLGSGNDQFNGPQQIALDGSGNIYVSDQVNGRVEFFTTSGLFNGTLYTGGVTLFQTPYAIAGDPTTNYFYLGDYGLTKVFKLDSDGNLLASFGSGGSGPGQFVYLAGIAVSADGAKVYVTDTGNYNVTEFDSSGNYLTSWGSKGTGNYQFGGSGSGIGPTGIAVDSSGYVYVVDPGNGLIKKFGP